MREQIHKTLLRAFHLFTFSFLTFSIPQLAHSNEGTINPSLVSLAALPVPAIYIAKSDNFYTHEAKINIYYTEQHKLNHEQLAKELQLAQSRFDKCKIKLVIDTLNMADVPTWMQQWESMEFNGGISPWEKNFFSHVPDYSVGIVFVESLDWTIGDDGIIAVGYGKFMVDSELLDEASADELEFYERKMVGYSVLGKAKYEWTLAHELGHSVMDLEHNEQPDNLMFSMGAKGRDPKFNQSQCDHAKKNSRLVTPL